MSIRDSNVIILEVSKTTVKAGLGLFELLKTPTIVRIVVFLRAQTRSLTFFFFLTSIDF